MLADHGQRDSVATVLAGSWY